MRPLVLPEKDGWNSPDDRQYDPAFVAYLGLIFDPSRAVVDVGANVGKMACFFAARSNAPIYCFEPGPSTFQALIANLPDRERIVAKNVALSDRSGVGRFIGDGTVTAHLSSSTRGNAVEVVVGTLDEYVPDHVGVGLIKIDVEGGEHAVLLGAARTIRQHRPLLAIEMIDEHLRRGGTSRAQIFSTIIGEYGYKRAVNKYGRTERPDKSSGASDVIFLPDESWYAPRLYLGYEKARGGDDVATGLAGALEKARVALYNGFEPDNQSKSYLEVVDALRRAREAGVIP